MIGEVFGVHVFHGALFGIEVEFEFDEDIPELDIPLYWDIKDDGSLRNGKEFVSIPINKRDVVFASEALFEYLSDIKIVHSSRTSTHVHVNMSDCTFVDCGVFCLTYAVLEDAIKEVLAINRMFSSFCFPTIKSHGWLEAVGDMVNGLRPHCDNHMRYCGLNYHSLERFGTLECRIFNSPKKASDIVEYVTILDNIRNYAIENSLVDLETDLKRCISGDISTFVDKVIGDSKFSKGNHEYTVYRILSFIRSRLLCAV